jgi:hypothetical protein
MAANPRLDGFIPAGGTRPVPALETGGSGQRKAPVDRAPTAT